MRMPITEDTRLEIEAALDGDFRLPGDYHSFLVKWLAFNRAYNDMELEASRDREKAVAVGKKLQQHWGEFSGSATQLVSLECVGGERVADSALLRPKEWVKSATLYLRDRLGLQCRADQDKCEFGACRPEKQRLCNDVEHDPWDKEEMAALLTLVYQVRCNFVHGDKRQSGECIQTDRDHLLVQISIDILDRVLKFLLQEE